MSPPRAAADLKSLGAQVDRLRSALERYLEARAALTQELRLEGFVVERRPDEAHG